MKLNEQDKKILESALQTEEARMRRAVNACKSIQIAEILSKEIQDLRSLAGRIVNEPVEKVAK